MTKLAFQQGTLDGLCGVYCLINAFLLILRKLLSEQQVQPLADALFRHILEECFPNRNLPTGRVVTGLSYSNLLHLAKDANAFVKTKLKGVQAFIREVDFGQCTKREWFSNMKELFDLKVEHIGSSLQPAMGFSDTSL